MSDIIQISPFPPVKWDVHRWIGKVLLPSSSGFQRRSSIDLSLLDNQPSDGSVRLEVAEGFRSRKAKQGQLKPMPPGVDQSNAFQYLLDNEAVVAAAIGHVHCCLLYSQPGRVRGTP